MNRYRTATSWLHILAVTCSMIMVICASQEIIRTCIMFSSATEPERCFLRLPCIFAVIVRQDTSQRERLYGRSRPRSMWSSCSWLHLTHSRFHCSNISVHSYFCEIWKIKSRTTNDIAVWPFSYVLRAPCTFIHDYHWLQKSVCCRPIITPPLCV